jgi:hypothetical protein
MRTGQAKALKKRPKSETHIILLLRSNRINEIVLGHVQLAIFVLLSVAQEVGAGLERQLGRLFTANQCALDGILDARHCVTEQDCVET